jgi:hypothetical protein
VLIPRPKFEEPEPPKVTGPTKAFTDWYLNVPNWTCKECEAVMFGRMLYCIYCKQRLAKDTRRPDEWNHQEIGK